MAVAEAPTRTRDLSVPERVLYHQVHPLKLATDVSTAAASLVLLAEHRPWLALGVMFGPSILVTVVLVRFGDFSHVRESRVGDYLRRYMTRAREGVRFAGYFMAAYGAWVHAWWLFPLGTCVIAWGWTGGWLLERRHP